MHPRLVSLAVGGVSVVEEDVHRVVVPDGVSQRDGRVAGDRLGGETEEGVAEGVLGRGKILVGVAEAATLRGQCELVDLHPGGGHLGVVRGAVGVTFVPRDRSRIDVHAVAEFEPFAVLPVEVARAAHQDSGPADQFDRVVARHGARKVAGAVAQERPDQVLPAVIGRVSLGVERDVPLIGVGVLLNPESDLLFGAEAVDRFGPLARLVERGEQHGGQDGDDRDHDQEFNQREIPCVGELFHNHAFLFEPPLKMISVPNLYRNQGPIDSLFKL